MHVVRSPPDLGLGHHGVKDDLGDPARQPDCGLSCRSGTSIRRGDALGVQRSQVLTSLVHEIDCWTWIDAVLVLAAACLWLCRLIDRAATEHGPRAARSVVCPVDQPDAVSPENTPPKAALIP
jgi:hypothetical protein